MSSARPVAWILLFAPCDRRAASEFTALKACVVVAHQAGALFSGGAEAPAPPLKKAS